VSSDKDFIVIIPARFGSSRFPGKVLVDIKGKPMIQHVIERALEAGAQQVVVATDDERVKDAIGDACTVVMTRDDHESGTERLAEVVDRLGLADDKIVVNVQGDEPFVPAANINQVAGLLNNAGSPMATLCTPLHDRKEAVNPNAVKVVRNHNDHALYFSRSTIPFERDALINDITNPAEVDLSNLRRHIGIYAYRAGYIKQYVSYTPSPLEKIESLEQLRALWYGDSIIVKDAVEPPPVGIDTPEDLQHLLRTI
jgi:3-deoxy-manno-octulosonate cytidylyltransferase (CMP-KDO synthetase)